MAMMVSRDTGCLCVIAGIGEALVGPVVSKCVLFGFEEDLARRSRNM